MKIHCNVCEAAEATVLCCADEAALCWACDETVHAANKLASKHQRVSLSVSSSQMPKCDICQETSGYIFCLEDRALLCRKCDVAIHTANPYVSGHQRFLLTGVKVGLQPTEPSASSSMMNCHSGEKNLEPKSNSEFRNGISDPSATRVNEMVPIRGDGIGEFVSNRLVGELGELLPAKVPYAGGSATGSFSQWHLDDYMGLVEFNQNYGSMDDGLSKADSSKLGDSDSSVVRASEEELDGNERLGQVPDASWTVPENPTPPTASGLHWPRNFHSAPDGACVPDICCFSVQKALRCQHDSRVSKRRRPF